MQRRFRADIGHQDSLLCLPLDQPSRSTIFRTGRLLTPFGPLQIAPLPLRKRRHFWFSLPFGF